jgi:hypothetical protein
MGLFEDAGADRRLNCLAFACLDDDRLRAPPLEHEREQQPRGARADDPDLCTHPEAPSNHPRSSEARPFRGLLLDTLGTTGHMPG